MEYTKAHFELTKIEVHEGLEKLATQTMLIPRNYKSHPTKELIAIKLSFFLSIK